MDKIPSVEGELLVNMIRTPDGTILESRYRWDYRSHLDAKTGEEYMVDGGLDYARRNVNGVKAEELSLYTTDPHELVRTRFTWGTYGKRGDSPMHYVALEDMSDLHIEAVLDGLSHGKIEDMFRNELEYRRLNFLTVED